MKKARKPSTVRAVEPDQSPLRVAADSLSGWAGVRVVSDPAQLAASRLADIHQQFRQAAMDYPDLCFVAATDHVEGTTWPTIPRPYGHDQLGLGGPEWCQLLQRQPGSLFTPHSNVWLRHDGRLWEGAIYDGAVMRLGEGGDLRERFAVNCQAVDQLMRLSGAAAGHLPESAPPDRMIDFPLKDEPAHRWLEFVLGRDFVTVDNRGEFPLRRLPGNVFTASARAIEELERNSIPGKTGVTSRETRKEGNDSQVAVNSAPGGRYDKLGSLKPAHRLAYLSFIYVESRAEKRLKDLEAWDWLKENGIDAKAGCAGELADYSPPDFPTWSRYLRAARKVTGEKKYTPRHGRALGRSIVRGDELEISNNEDA